MMLRSAEADPHNTERVVHRDAEAPRAAAQGLHDRGRRRSASLDRATEPPPGWLPSGPLQPSRSVRRHRSRCALAEASAPPERQCVTLAEASGRGPVESLAERPATGPCSADESVDVVPPLPAARRSFLPWALFPFEVPRAPFRCGRAWAAGARRAEARVRRACLPPRRAAVRGGQPGSLLGLPRVGEPKPARAAPSGAEAEPRASAFSAPSHGPEGATSAIAPPKRGSQRGPVPGESVRCAKSWSAFRDAASIEPPPKR